MSTIVAPDAEKLSEQQEGTVGAALGRIALWIAAVVGVVVLINIVAGSPDSLSVFSTRFLGIFIEAAPFLLAGTLVAGLIDSFVTAEHITRFLPRNRFLAVLSGVFLGMAFPVCECGVVPVVRRLYTKNLPLSVGVAFLLASPVMNPIVILSTLAAFGFGPVLIGRVLITVVVALAVGLVFALGAGPKEVLNSTVIDDMQAAQQAAHLPAAAAPLADRLRRAVVVASDEFFEMGRYLIAGSLLAAAMQTLVAQETLLALGRGPVVSVLVMQSLAFLLSVCSTVDAFLALAFTGAFTTGSILAFLTFGPMVDIKSMLMFAGVFRRKTVVYLIVLPLLLTMLIAIWLNLNVRF